MTQADGDHRGQTNLPVLAIALVVLTGVTGMAVVMAEGAYLSAERSANERGIAVSAADRLVAANADHTRRANVLDSAEMTEFSESDLVALAPATAGADVRVRIGETVVVERGDPDSGTTVRRIALLSNTSTWRGETGTDEDGLTVPHRTERVRIDVDGDVRTVRIDDRVVAHDPDGIDGTDGQFRVATSRHGTVRVSAAGDGGTVAVEATVEERTETIVSVTVDE